MRRGLGGRNRIGGIPSFMSPQKISTSHACCSRECVFILHQEERENGHQGTRGTHVCSTTDMANAREELIWDADFVWAGNHVR